MNSSLYTCKHETQNQCGETLFDHKARWDAVRRRMETRFDMRPIDMRLKMF